MALWSREDGKRTSHRLAAWAQPVALRLAACTDLDALERLAELDSRPLPPAPHLIAERDGTICAALSLATHEIVADPFRRTAELCELLRCYAGGMRTTEERSARRLDPQPRLVTA
jgi:hypothetical protein